MSNISKYICIFLAAASMSGASLEARAARLSVSASVDSTTLIQASKAMIKVEVSGAGDGGQLVAAPEAGQD